MKILSSALDVHPRGPRDTKKKKAILIGATGATGKQLLKQLLDSDHLGWDHYYNQKTGFRWTRTR